MKYYKSNGLTGNPANAVLFFFDNKVPLWFRVAMFFVGCIAWGSFILILVAG